MLKSGMDINVTGVWQQNITGHGVTVAVIDDGMRTQVCIFGKLLCCVKTLAKEGLPCGDSSQGSCRLCCHMIRTNFCHILLK